MADGAPQTLPSRATDTPSTSLRNDSAKIVLPARGRPAPPWPTKHFLSEASNDSSHGHRDESVAFASHVEIGGAHTMRPSDGFLRTEYGASVPTNHISEIFKTRSRTYSDSEGSKYDMITGERLDQRHVAQEEQCYGDGQPHWPLLQSTVDQLARARMFKAESSDVVGPLVASHLTFSPSIEPSQSPIDSSPSLASSPSTFPSLDEVSVTLSPRLRALERAKNQNSDIPGPKRRQSRRSSARSNTSAASSFLSQFGRSSSVPATQPDDDGQCFGHNNEFVIGKQVGFGGFSVVKEVYTLNNGKQHLQAVKIVRKHVPGKSEEENEKLQCDFEHEVSIWRNLQHPHILPLVTAFDNSFATFCVTHMNTGGTLFDLVRSRRKTVSSISSLRQKVDPGVLADAGIPVRTARRYLSQLASALQYLHLDMRIVHRDIKLENCLLNLTGPDCQHSDGNVLLCDFGMADWITHKIDDAHCETSTAAWKPYMDAGPHNIGPSETSTSVAGSLQYASPELIRASRPLFIPAIDIWAFGVVSYALFTAELPFTHSFLPRLQVMILKGQWNGQALLTALERASAVGGAGNTDVVMEFVTSCLNMDAGKRWTIADVLKSEFLGTSMD